MYNKVLVDHLDNEKAIKLSLPSIGAAITSQTLSQYPTEKLREQVTSSIVSSKSSICS